MSNATVSSDTRREETTGARRASRSDSTHDRGFLERLAERAKWDAYYSQHPVSDDSAGPVHSAAIAQELARLLPDGGRVLEIGCGAGAQSLALARLQRFDLDLMDFSAPALQCAEAAFRRESMAAHFIRGDVFDMGSPEYDLVFNAGSLEHYSAEHQIAFLRGMASRSRRFVLALVPNNLCYWYWLWRIHAVAQDNWPFGRETPVSDLSEALRQAGLSFLGEAFLGETWTEDFIASLGGMDAALREQILRVHRSAVIPQAQKAYLYGALGAVDPSLTIPAGSAFAVGLPKPVVGEPEWQTAQADLLAARQNGERLRADLHSRQQDCVRLTAEADKSRLALESIERSLAWRAAQAVNAFVDRCRLRWLLDVVTFPFQSRHARATLSTKLPAPLRRTADRIFSLPRTSFFSHRRALADFEALVSRRRGMCKKLFVQVSTVDWSITLHQRPQHMVRAMGDCGCLAVYLQPSSTHGFREVAPNVFVGGGSLADAWLARVENALVSVYSTSPVAVRKARRLLALLKRNQVLYEYIDHLDPRISGEHTPQVVAFQEFVLRFRQRFLFVATARQLFDELARRVAAERIALIPNGVDTDHYRLALGNPKDAAQVSSEMQATISKGRPIVGYFGAMAPWLDYALIADAATACPDCEFVFLGPDYLGGSKLLPVHLPNFHWLGAVSYDALPHYAKSFAVAVIPFARGDIAKTTSPLKLFEYFALGLPVVVTADLTECSRYPEVFVGESSPGFITSLREALARRDDTELRTRVRSLAEQNTWRRRAEALLEFSARSELGHNLAAEFSVPTSFVSTYLAQQGVATGTARRWSELRTVLPGLQQLYFEFALTTVSRGRGVFQMLQPFLSRHRRSRRYLDVGCGYGGFVRVFAEHGWTATGIEIVPRLAACSRATCEGLANTKIVEGDLMVATVMGEFECITCNDVIEHVADAEAALGKLLSLLAKGGVLFLEIPNKDCLDFVAKDGHFLLFGINLLPREEAAAYHEAMTGETGYLGHMGEFHPLSFYTSIISRHGFKHALLDRHITGSAADLPRKREELVAAHDNWEREWGGRLPAGIAENLERKYRAYLQKLDQDVNQRTEAATLVRTYLSSFWSIVVE